MRNNDNIQAKMMYFANALCQIMPLGMSRRIEHFVYRTLFRKKDKMHSYYHQRGNNAREVFVLRWPFPFMGLFSAGIEYLSEYDYLKKKGVHPYMLLECDQVFAEGRIGDVNIWNCVFVQETDIEEEMKKGSTVYINMVNNPYALSYGYNKKINQDLFDSRVHVTRENWRRYYARIYPYTEKIWKFRPEITEYCEKFYRDHFGKTDVVLGIMMREEMTREFKEMLNGEYEKVALEHPENPGFSEMLTIVKRQMEQWGCTKMFVCTMFEETVAAYKKEFLGRVVVLDRVRDSFFRPYDEERMNLNYGVQKNYEIFNRNREYYIQRTLEYAYEVKILSMCDFAVLPKCSGSAAALAINGGKYRDIYVTDDARKVEFY